MTARRNCWSQTELDMLDDLIARRTPRPVILASFPNRSARAVDLKAWERRLIKAHPLPVALHKVYLALRVRDMTTAELAEELGVYPSKVQPLLHALAGRGLVQKVRRVPAGRSATAAVWGATDADPGPITTDWRPEPAATEQVVRADIAASWMMGVTT